MNSNESIRIQLPGYECQLNQDGVTHSRQKVESALNDLLEENVISILVDEKKELEKQVLTIPCQTHEETLNYRSSCTFQIVQEKISQHEFEMQYAMRCCKEAVPLQTDYFPVATPRIQKVMKLVMGRLNHRQTLVIDNQNPTAEKVHWYMHYKYECIRKNLSSISFVASWRDDLDCVVTFNYSQPLYDYDNDVTMDAASTVCDNSRTKMLSQAAEFFRDCNDSISSLILRSKNLKETIGRPLFYIEDVLYLKRMQMSSVDVVSGVDAFKVCLALDGVDDNDNGENYVPIFYSKPIDAFHHPNRNTMLQALNWMMNRLKALRMDSDDGCKRGVHNMLEMYCGCGAHTMAIAKSNIFDSIVAIELDQRLVDACIVNCKRNGCFPMTKEDSGTHGATTMVVETTPVYVFQGDASEWAKKIVLKNKNKRQQKTETSNTVSNNYKSSKSYWYNQYYHVLLVDPPRMGLGEDVINLAIHGSFEHIIYVSCGKRALIRDLKLLRETFDIVDLVITDLFPRTDSVETILHLRRKQPPQT